MSTTIRRLCGIGLAAAALVGLTTATATARPGESQVGGSYQLSISDADGLRSEASLTCYPHGGTHPDPYAACAQLTASRGNVAAVAEDPGPCTLEYDPVTLRSQGLWGNTYRVWEATFANQCAANRDTGGVLFDF